MFGLEDGHVGRCERGMGAETFRCRTSFKVVPRKTSSKLVLPARPGCRKAFLEATTKQNTRACCQSAGEEGSGKVTSCPAS